MEDRCVVCGRIIPEGRMVCQMCESMGKEYCGKTLGEMNAVLDAMCEIEDRIELTSEEQEAFDIAIQCITTVMHSMKD